MMPRRRLLQLPLAGKVFLAALAIVYTVYLVGLVRSGNVPFFTSSPTIVAHQEDTNLVLHYWTAASMSSAVNADEQVDNSTSLSQGNVDTSQLKAAQQQGQPPSNGDATFPLTTVGKLFFSNDSGQNFVCSGTAIISDNHNTVDSAGHCFYWNGDWVRNVVFCPQYDNGDTPFGCWAARALEVPEDWINAKPNDLHHDFGMAIVAPNATGNLTDVVGGAGWAYNQPTNQTFYAYGYPAGYPFDGQTRKSCEGAGKSWQHGGGTVVSIPCNMTGGSSGGPWFIRSGDNWYLDGHNDFTSSMQRGHMFSPYYDDTWYALYQKSQQS